ncbi:hypothetical protein CC117_22810 [Parafrankia colletiae]|uniref:HTH luxR-type domain-containing protein n=1 Tax=Parafrankia colletiae TaxID=573497 RepID=A0A1S1QJR4_9ACTN|nr:AAA family ATPase [Parafrankia colletiae]MCK9901462.1 AAA family ATPase [Frankia sp. Cpl3]OHV33495.1 hypothetical protein CC117_22810 [Parafrankia colletiae]
MDLLERDREVAVVRAAIDGATAGQGSGVAVAGESGAGKSALLAAARAAAPGPRFLLGGCDPLLTPRPLGPFRDIAAAAGLGPLLPGEDRATGQEAGGRGAEPPLAVRRPSSVVRERARAHRWDELASAGYSSLDVEQRRYRDAEHVLDESLPFTVARGLTNAEIATRLYISVKTADHRVSAILTKLGLPTRRAVALRADELGLV